jgi:hypothetical protein
MATIEVRCNVKLSEAIVLATQQDASYGAIRWTLANGDTVTVEMDIPEDEIRRSYQEHSSRGNWYVNYRVQALRISIRLENVSADDLDRLYARHTSEPTWVAHFETSAGEGLDQSYQEAPELGRRVIAEIRETVNLILRFVRDNYGQHWLRPLSQDEKSLQNFLDDVQAEWREAMNPWKRLLIASLVTSIGSVYVGVMKLYLEVGDWQTIQQAVGRKEEPSSGFALLSDSRERYYQGEPRIAIIYLNSALEWAVQRFLRNQLSSKIPSEALQEVLRQTHARLLSDWVLPLDRIVGLGLEHKEWPSIVKIQKLRRKAGHATASSEIGALTDLDFEKLVRDASTAIAKLNGLVAAKIPPPMVGILAGGTV